MNNFNTLSFCIDFDNCADSPEARQEIIDFILNKVNSCPSCENIVISIGSARQSFHTDFYTSVHNHYHHETDFCSASILGCEFIDELNDQIEQKIPENNLTVYFNNLLMGDVFDNLPDGTMFNFMRKFNDHAEFMNDHSLVTFQAKNNESKTIKLFSYRKNNNIILHNAGKSHFIHDEYKLLILYLCMHATKKSLPDNAYMMFYFLDDRMDILEKNTQVLEQNQLLIPENCSFQAYQCDSFYKIYPSNLSSYKGDIITGKGALNTHYRELYLQLYRLLKANPPPELILHTLLACIIKQKKELINNATNNLLNNTLCPDSTDPTSSSSSSSTPNNSNDFSCNISA